MKYTGGALLGMDKDGSENYTKDEKVLIEAYSPHTELQRAVRLLMGIDNADK